MLDKAILTEYDSMVLVDKSGSMGAKTPNFASRWLEAQEITNGIASLAAETDEDGITFISFGGAFDASKNVQDGVKADAVATLFSASGPGGTTPTAAALEAAFQKHFSSQKKSLIFVVTDGIPDDKDAVAKSIVSATQKLKDASEIRLLFLQVGDDASAAQWLDELDNNLKGAKFDIVNSISFKDANGLTAIDLFERALNDSH